MSRSNFLLYYAGDIVDGDEDHQGYKDEEANFLKDKLLSGSRRSAPGPFPEEKCKLSSVQGRDGEDIYQGQIKAEKSQEANEDSQPMPGRLPCGLYYEYGTSNEFGGDLAKDKPFYKGDYLPS